MDLAAAAKRIDAYERLIRLDKPIGALLLLWPTLWAVWIASNGRPTIEIEIGRASCRERVCQYV